MLVTVALGNGFILTAMLWGGFLAEMIDRRLRLSALYLGILAVFTFFGVVHSSSPDGIMYLPWRLTGLARAVPYQFALAYAVFAALLLLLSFSQASKEPPADDLGHPDPVARQLKSTASRAERHARQLGRLSTPRDRWPPAAATDDVDCRPGDGRAGGRAYSPASGRAHGTSDLGAGVGGLPGRRLPVLDQPPGDPLAHRRLGPRPADRDRRSSSSRPRSGSSCSASSAPWSRSSSTSPTPARASSSARSSSTTSSPSRCCRRSSSSPR